MNFRSLTILAICALIGPYVDAQNGNIYLEDSSIQIVQSAQKRNLAWCGGFNSPNFANADLNHDGLQDRVVRTFINKGTSTVANYIYAPAFAKAFPLCYDYVLMPDYNRDGIPDLIH